MAQPNIAPTQERERAASAASSVASRTAANRAPREARHKWAVRVRRGLLLLLTLAGAAGVVWAWLPKPVPVDIALAQRGHLQVTVDEDGRTRVKNRYVVSAPLLANVARIELHPGDTVAPGNVLARLVPLEPPLLDARTKAQAEARVAGARASQRQAAASVARARAALQFAERESLRQRGLIKSGASSELDVERAELQARTLREELASAEFGARVAAYELEMAEAALGRIGKPHAKEEQLEVTAPVGGRVLRLIQENEGAVQPGAPLLEIGDPSALEIVVDVLTSDAIHVRAGARASIERWGGERPLRAHVRLVEPSAFTRISALGVEEQRVNVVLDLDEPQSAWAALGDGYRVEGRIVTWEADDVLSVPANTAFRSGEGWAVFAVVEGRARLTPVVIGQVNAEHVEIRKGLRAGDAVIMYPGDSVHDGVRVERRQP